MIEEARLKEEQEKRLKEAHEAFAASPFWQLLGFNLQSIEPGEVEITMESRKELTNTMATVHGGVFASLIDTTMGITARSIAGQPFTTVNLNVHYLKSISSGKIRSKGKVISNGRSIFTVQAEIFDENDQLCVYGTGTFKMLRKSTN